MAVVLRKLCSLSLYYVCHVVVKQWKRRGSSLLQVSSLSIAGTSKCPRRQLDYSSGGFETDLLSDSCQDIIAVVEQAFLLLERIEWILARLFAAVYVFNMRKRETDRPTELLTTSFLPGQQTFPSSPGRGRQNALGSSDLLPG